MLRPFQVNVGHYLTLEQDVSPASKVSELCSAIEAVSGEAAENQVLLTSDGKQMDPTQLIGAYSVGTETKPIFVFYRSYLGSPEPPQLPSQLPHRGDLQHQLELLKLRPAPALFHKQVALAKRLCEYSQVVSRVCGLLSEQYTLQCNGWQTVLNNCYSITRTFNKHQQLFTEAVEGFRIAKPEYLQLLQDFPERVKLLQKLPVPSSLQSSNVSSSLYDWISTHDERNSLLDLSSECKRSLERVESDHLDTAIQSFQQVIDESDIVCSHDDQFNSDFHSLIVKVTEMMETTAALNQNIQSTSERALRSGDAGTIANLVFSHHKSLQLMLDYASQMEAVGHDLEVAKMALTRHIHRKLQEVTQLQKKVANSNSQLVLLHEHIKLARKRFEILEQVCSTPRVLVNVLSEVERRRAFNSALEKKAKEVSLFLQQARNEEKRLRKSFFSNYGQHFVSSLFPELQDRLADIPVHLPKSNSTASVTLGGEYENLRQLLPQDMRPSLETSSVDLLVTPFVPTGSDHIPSTDPPRAATTAGRTGLLSDGIVEMAESSAQTGASLPQSIGEEGGSSELIKLLEATNEELAMKLARSGEEQKQQRERFEQQLSALRETAARVEQTMEENVCLSQCVSKLESRERELCLSVEKSRGEKKGLVEQLSKMENSYKDLSNKLEHCLSEKDGVQVELTALKDQLASQGREYFNEKDHLLQQLKQLETARSEERNTLLGELSSLKDQLATLAVEKDNLQQQIKQLELTSGSLLADQLQSSTKKVQLEESLQRLTSTHSQLKSTHDRVLQELSLAREQLKREETAWQEERAKIKTELVTLTAKLEDQKSMKETLLKQAAREEEMTSKTASLQQKVKRLQSCEAELEKSKNKLTKVEKDLQDSRAERENLQKKCKELASECVKLKEQCAGLMEEQKRQNMRHQRAQSTLTTLQAKLEQADKKIKEKDRKVQSTETKLKTLEAKLQEFENGESENQKVITELRKQVEEFKDTSQAKIVAAKNAAEDTRKELLGMKEQLESKEAMLQEVDAAASEAKVKLELVLKEKDEDLETLREEKDRYLKQAMECERELRELRRDVGQEPTPPVPVPFPGPLVPVLKQPEKATPPMSPVGGGGGTPLPKRVAMANLQVGDVALFMNDSFNNYLALTLDGRLYYLSNASVPWLKDLGVKITELHLKRKILVGKITERILVEVKKESNRLKIPAGTRLYRVKADHVNF